MKKKMISQWVFPLLIMGMTLLFSSCSKKDNNTTTTTPTPTSGTLTDYDGNSYNYITIGTQMWMTSNLKVIHYNDGTAIPLVASDASWGALTTGAYYYYNGVSGDISIYGMLYNWYAASSGKLAPTGWHVPSNAEWTTLINYLGGSTAAGGAMKTTGTTQWANPNTGATNSSGFTALAGGYRSNTGAYSDILSDGNFWSTTAVNTTMSYGTFLYYGSAAANQNDYTNKVGCSIRCIKN